MGVDPLLSQVAALSLSVLLLVAASHKLRAPQVFASQLADYQLTPRWAEPALQWSLPVAELMAALGLLAPASRYLAALLAMALLMVYTSAIAINLMRGRRRIDCGCLGPALRQELSPWLLGRNALLLLLGGVALWPITVRDWGWHDHLITVLASVALLLLYVAANTLIAYLPQYTQLREKLK